MRKRVERRSWQMAVPTVQDRTDAEPHTWILTVEAWTKWGAKRKFRPVLRQWVNP